MKEGAQQAVVPRPAAAGSALVPACNAKGRDTMPEWMQGGCEAGGAREAAVGSEPLYRLAVDEDEVRRLVLAITCLGLHQSCDCMVSMRGRKRHSFGMPTKLR